MVSGDGVASVDAIRIPRGAKSVARLIGRSAAAYTQIS